MPAGRDYEYFCDAVADLYVGIRPDVPDGRFDADFALYRLGGTRLGLLSTPPVPASRGRRSLRQLPDDAVFVNFSRAAWALDHLGTASVVPAGSAFVIDNEQSFRIAFDPVRRVRLYSLRVPRAALGPVTAGTIRRADETATSSESGRRLATQMSLLAAMIDTGAVTAASLMAPVVVELLRQLLHPGGRDAPTRLARLMDISRSRLTDPDFGLAALARESHWSARTVQAAFAAEGLLFSEWLTGERLDLARAMLTDPASEGRGIAHVAHAAGFADTSTFFRAFRRRFGTTPGSARHHRGADPQRRDLPQRIRAAEDNLGRTEQHPFGYGGIEHDDTPMMLPETGAGARDAAWLAPYPLVLHESARHPGWNFPSCQQGRFRQSGRSGPLSRTVTTRRQSSSVGGLSCDCSQKAAL